MENIRLIIFDLDGTLFRPGEVAVEALYSALEETAREFQIDIRFPEEEEIYRSLGQLDYRFIESLNLNLNKEQAEHLLKTFGEIESMLIEEGEGELYEGAVAALQILKDSGYQLALASCLRRDYLLAIMDHFDLDRYIDFAVSIDDVGRGEETEILSEIIDNQGALPSETAYVADRETNFRAARQIGIIAVGCAWGFGEASELRQADYVVDSFSELVDLFTER